MTSKKQAAITLRHDGAEYQFKISTNAMCRFQDETGESILAAVEKFASPQSFDMRSIRALLWAGLAPNVSIEDAGDLIDGIGFERAVELISEAVSVAFPASQGGPEGNDKEQGSKT